MKVRVVRHHFLLVEILVALSLVMLCVFPLLYTHHAVLKEEAIFVIESHCERIADNTYSEIKENLYRQRYSLGDVQRGVIDSFEDIEIPSLLSDSLINIKRKAYIDILGKEDKYYILGISLELQPDCFYLKPSITKYKIIVEEGL